MSHAVRDDEGERLLFLTPIDFGTEKPRPDQFKEAGVALEDYRYRDVYMERIDPCLRLPTVGLFSDVPLELIPIKGRECPRDAVNTLIGRGYIPMILRAGYEMELTRELRTPHVPTPPRVVLMLGSYVRIGGVRHHPCITSDGHRRDLKLIREDAELYGANVYSLAVSAEYKFR